MKKTNLLKMSGIFAAVMLLFALVSCGDGAGGPDPDPANPGEKYITSIDVTGVKTEFNVGEFFSLGAAVVTVNYNEGSPDTFTGFTLEQLEAAGITVDFGAFVSDVPSTAPIPIVVSCQGFSTPFTYYVTVIDPDPLVVTPVITITTHPEAETSVYQGEISGSLVVAATVTEGGTPIYQWYSNDSAGNIGGTAVSSDGNTAIFNIPDDLTAAGSPYYYFCEVSAAGAEPKRSSAATVIVIAAEEEFYVDSIYYKRISRTNVKVTNQHYDDEAELGDVINSYGGDVVIPSTVSYGGIDYDVIAIGSRAFYGSQRLSSVTLPDSIKTIENDYAFAECTSSSLSITLNEGLETIGANAFYNCPYLTTLNIPSTVTSICGDAPVFRGCARLLISADEGGVFSADEYGVLFQSGSGDNADKPRYYLRWIPEWMSGPYVILDGVSEICQFSVDYIAPLSELTFPASVSTIRTINNFRVMGFRLLRFLGTIPPEMPDGIGELRDYGRMGIVLYVPRGSGGAYDAGIWGSYFKISEY